MPKPFSRMEDRTKSYMQRRQRSEEDLDAVNNAPRHPSSISKRGGGSERTKRSSGVGGSSLKRNATVPRPFSLSLEQRLKGKRPDVPASSGTAVGENTSPNQGRPRQQRDTSPNQGRPRQQRDQRHQHQHQDGDENRSTRSTRAGGRRSTSNGRGRPSTKLTRPKSPNFTRRRSREHLAAY